MITTQSDTSVIWWPSHESNSLEAFKKKVLVTRDEVYKSIIGSKENNPQLQQQRWSLDINMDEMKENGTGRMKLSSYGFDTYVMFEHADWPGQENNPNHHRRSLYLQHDDTTKEYILSVEFYGGCENIRQLEIQSIVQIINFLHACKAQAKEKLDINKDITTPFQRQWDTIILSGHNFLDTLWPKIVPCKAVRMMKWRSSTPLRISSWPIKNKLSEWVPESFHNAKFCDILNKWRNFYKTGQRVLQQQNL
jgi:hypothetical protein